MSSASQEAAALTARKRKNAKRGNPQAAVSPNLPFTSKETGQSTHYLGSQDLVMVMMKKAKTYQAFWITLSLDHPWDIWPMPMEILIL